MFALLCDVCHSLLVVPLSIYCLGLFNISICKWTFECFKFATFTWWKSCCEVSFIGKKYVLSVFGALHVTDMMKSWHSHQVMVLLVSKLLFWVLICFTPLECFSLVNQYVVIFFYMFLLTFSNYVKSCNRVDWFGTVWHTSNFWLKVFVNVQRKTSTMCLTIAL